MREEPAVHLRERGVGPAVIGVAVTAGEVRVVVFHPAVHRSDLLHLPGNRGMANHASVCHGFFLPRRGVAGFAVAPGFGMRSDAAQRLPALSAQLTRAVQNSAFGIGEPGNDQRGDQRRSDPHAGQASQTIAFHFFVLCYLRKVA